MLISIIITTYNWPEALVAVLRSLRDQEDRDFEIVVADDGSDHHTRDAIALSYGLHVEHVWHEDRGFRLAEIRNRAVLKSRGDYLIFLDGDCIPRPSFVGAHRRLAEPGWFVVGNRILLREKMTKRVLTENLAPEDWSIAYWWVLRRLRHCNRIAPMITLPLGPLRRRVNQSWKRAMGCNLGAWRADVERVNGFDASFCGWGWEDNDFFVRMLRAGVKRKTGRFATGVIHLHHEPVYSAANRARFDATLSSKRIHAVNGLYEQPPETLPKEKDDSLTFLRDFGEDVPASIAAERLRAISDKKGSSEQ